MGRGERLGKIREKITKNTCVDAVMQKRKGIRKRLRVVL